MYGMRKGAMGEAVGGGIFALRRPRPYRRHCGELPPTNIRLTDIKRKRRGGR